MGKITLILGGSRSGKSKFAVRLAKAQGRKIAFIATAEAKDPEMQKRIAWHKKSRPRQWQTFEEPLKVANLLKKIGNQFDYVIIDCLTLLVSNLFLKGYTQKPILQEIKRICLILNKLRSKTIIISNEVGLGIVPENKLARDFRDIAGKVNQIIAKKAEQVFLMTAGLPLRLK